MRPFAPAYIASYASGQLSEKIKDSKAILKNCVLCPRRCKVDRLSDEKGICRTGKLAAVSSFSPHFGEEAPLVGRHGSGTIFFTHCNLLCNFCQNYDISHQGWGSKITDDQLAAIMITLQDRGCHNINFVTPTHVVPQILSALEIAVENGLNVPLVYNSSGYDSVDALRILEGIFDIYMPDFKFWDCKVADSTCNAPDYPEVAINAITEMHRQVGDLSIDEQGIAQRGLLLRHLVLPDGLAGTREVMKFIYSSISQNTYVNVMSQYRPCGRSDETPGLERPVTAEEFRDAVKAAKNEGIIRLDRVW